MGIKHLEPEALFFRKVQVDAFIQIKEQEMRPMTQISHEIQMTYCYLVRLLKGLEKTGLIEFVKKDNRAKVPRLTDKGRRVREMIINIQNEIGED